jgi:asparagine synthase (glutamine-hydrolysing)
MCGIAGIIPKLNTQFSLEETMQNMLQAIAHRGPDGQDTYNYQQQLILGHRRLAILDLSADGTQPMHSEDGQYTIVFNGEIYNYLEIKQQLIAQGYKFHNHTDTEVILQAYRHWGKECVQYFNGMWAFAILDKSEQILFCSRDRFGVKPFYYIEHEHYWAFCSEIKGLLP